MRTVFAQKRMESFASAFRQGLHTGITCLFEAWYTPLCSYINYLINDYSAAEEIASEAFLKTWKYREQFHSSNDIRAYLFTVARRDAAKWIHHKQKQPRLNEVDQQHAITNEAPEILQQEMQTIICNAIRTLPPRCRQIFEMLYIEDKNVEEIADILLISPYTVRAQKARGLNLLRPKLLTFLDGSKG